MTEFFFKLFFNNDSWIGYLTDWFDLRIEDEKILSAHPFWILIAFAICWSLLAYLIGSINFSLVISKLFYRDDIRRYGSHNAGTTNMKRVFGMKAALLTLAGDMVKGVVATLVPLLLISKSAAYLSGFCCILGHCFPIFFKFKGGKGVATSIAVILTLDPLVGLLLIGIFVIIVAGTKYISMGSIMAAFFFPILLDRVTKILHGNDQPPTALMAICALFMTILIIFQHRSNIMRIVNGEENKFSFKKTGSNSQKTSNPSAKDVKSLHRIDEDVQDNDQIQNSQKKE